jgi:hypothetical protein
MHCLKRNPQSVPARRYLDGLSRETHSIQMLIECTIVKKFHKWYCDEQKKIGIEVSNEALCQQHNTEGICTLFQQAFNTCLLMQSSKKAHTETLDCLRVSKHPQTMEIATPVSRQRRCPHFTLACSSPPFPKVLSWKPISCLFTLLQCNFGLETLLCASR